MEKKIIGPKPKAKGKSLPKSQRGPLLEKYMFALHTKHTQQKINRFTSFTIDNMYYVSFRI